MTRGGESRQRVAGPKNYEAKTKTTGERETQRERSMASWTGRVLANEEGDGGTIAYFSGARDGEERRGTEATRLKAGDGWPLSSLLGGRSLAWLGRILCGAEDDHQEECTQYPSVIYSQWMPL
ncbi:hypothetical protein BJX76DRAFT_320168 [Aspergillus varians]